MQSVAETFKSKDLWQASGNNMKCQGVEACSWAKARERKR